MDDFISISTLAQDTPVFNARLTNAGEKLVPTRIAVNSLRESLEAYHESGLQHIEASSTLVQSMRNLSLLFVVDGTASPDGKPTEEPLKRLAETIEQANEHHRILMQQLDQLVLEQSKQLTLQIHTAEEAYTSLKSYDQMRNSAMQKYLQSTPTMVTSDGVDEEYARRAEKAFTARRVYQGVACDFALEINRLHSDAKFEFLKKVNEQIFAYHGYYKQGATVFDDISVYAAKLFNVIGEADRSAKAITAAEASLQTSVIDELQDVYSLDVKSIPPVVKKPVLVPHEEKGFRASYNRLRLLAQEKVQEFTDKKTLPLKAPKPDGLVNLEEAMKRRATSGKKQGWVLVRMSKTLTTTWKPIFIAVHGDSVVSIDEAGHTEELCVLQLTNVKPCLPAITDRLHCLQITSPHSKIIIQTQGSRDMAEWQMALREEISRALSGATKDGCPVDALTLAVGNNMCADCSSSDVNWASVNLGVLLCIRCCGAHRSLGVNLSKVRSIKLDSWTEEMVQRIKDVGNFKANQYYEARLESFPDDNRPGPDSSQDEVYNWVTAKYVDKKYIGDETLNPIAAEATTLDTVMMDDVELNDTLDEMLLTPPGHQHVITGRLSMESVNLDQTMNETLLDDDDDDDVDDVDDVDDDGGKDKANSKNDDVVVDGGDDDDDEDFDLG